MAEVGALHLGSSVQKLAAAHGMDSVRGKQISRWMVRAHQATTEEQATVVCLVPAWTDTKWWHPLSMKHEMRLIRGRLRFGEASASAPFSAQGSACTSNLPPPVSPSAATTDSKEQRLQFHFVDPLLGPMAVLDDHDIGSRCHVHELTERALPRQNLRWGESTSSSHRRVGSRGRVSRSPPPDAGGKLPR